MSLDDGVAGIGDGGNSSVSSIADGGLDPSGSVDQGRGVDPAAEAKRQITAFQNEMYAVSQRAQNQAPSVAQNAAQSHNAPHLSNSRTVTDADPQPLAGKQYAQALPQDNRGIGSSARPLRPSAPPVGTGNVIRPNFPHWNGPPLADSAGQRGPLAAPRGEAAGLGRPGGTLGRGGTATPGAGLAAIAPALGQHGFGVVRNHDVGQLARDTGIVLDVENNPYHQAIAQEYTKTQGPSWFGRALYPPTSQDQARGVVLDRLGELATLPPAETDKARTQPAAPGAVRLQVGAVAHTVAANDAQPDPACHPNGFWAPDPQHGALKARSPDAARYQDQIVATPASTTTFRPAPIPRARLPYKLMTGASRRKRRVRQASPSRPSLTRSSDMARSYSVRTNMVF
jgi:hypothetical protein